MLAWNPPFLPWHRLQGRKGTPISPTLKVVAICGAGSPPPGLSLDAHPVAIRLLGGHRSSHAKAAICCRHMPKGCTSVDQARNPKISAGRPGSASSDKGGGSRRNRNRATRLAGTFKSRPTNAAILTRGKAGIGPPLLQPGFLSHSRGRGDGGRLKPSRLIGRCIG